MPDQRYANTAIVGSTQVPRDVSTRLNRPGLAVVTGASTGIGYELARCCAENGFDLIIAADEPEIANAAAYLSSAGASVQPVEADLSTPKGVDELYAILEGRPVEILIANAGRGLGGAFLDQDFAEIARVVDTNICGTLYLLHKVARGMRDRRKGRILITGSIAGFIPGSYTAVYNATKAFIDSFAFALRNELKDTECHRNLPDAGSDGNRVFSALGHDGHQSRAIGKDDPVDVARVEYEAMMRGDADVVSGWKNKLQSAMAAVTPSETLAEMHRKQAEPGSGTE